MVDFGMNNNPGSSGSRFVCPNDRQLALRAKLKTGWSVKTGTGIGYHSQVQSNNEPLCPEEQAAIISVIKRAEELDMTEQERVGMLIERLETMRRKVLGRNPSQCLLCGDGFGMLGSQKVICMDCKRLVCHKCAIDSCPGKTSCSKDHWLCMICSETREIWKKSGAWFFKSIPKYVLPGESKFDRSKGSRKSKNGKNKGFRDEDSSSDEEWKIRTKMHRSNSSTESATDINIHFEQTSYPMSAYSRQTSSNESQNSKEDFLKPYPSTTTLSEPKVWEDVAPDGGKTDNSGEGSETRSTNDQWFKTEGKNEDRRSPSTCSATSSIFKNPTEERKIIDLSLGTMDLSLTYDPINSTLHCTIYRAKNLTPMDINGLSDPYCKVNIFPATKTSTRLRTKTVHKTRNPEFNENLTFYDITENDLMKKYLHILVADEDKYGHDFLGETKINLAKLKIQNTMYLTLPLEKFSTDQRGPLPAPEMHQWFDDLWSRGQILLSLCYSTKRRSLLVTVVRCANLLPMDNNGFSDPFVKLQLKPDPNRRKHKTTVKWRDLNPVWNEEFAFETRPTELATQGLFVTVFDRDYGKSDDYLGGLIVGGVGSKGQRLKQWLDMIRYPDHHHEYWHNLTDEVLK